MMRKVIVKLTAEQPWVTLIDKEELASPAELHDEGTPDEFIRIADEEGVMRYVYKQDAEGVTYHVLDEEALLERLRQAIQDCEAYGEVVGSEGLVIEGAMYNEETNQFIVE